jgi:GNAT superfamily N-acetyltransferase
MRENEIEIRVADLGREDHQQAIIRLLDGYARDPMGDGKGLSEEVRRELIPGLRRHPTTAIFIAYRDDKAVGLAVCFLGFSTFAAKPLLNIHDFYVEAASRGLGVARNLMGEIERYARGKGCCKLTLEVLEKNQRALSLYTAAGFGQAVYAPGAGGAQFLWKPI